MKGNQCLKKMGKRSRIAISLCASAVLATALMGCSTQGTSEPTTISTEARAVAEESIQPNVLMILLDDLGYTDLGSFGGEAETPNIDALAAEGTQFTNFHAYPLCAPTRAALMTGQNPHKVGLGSMEGLTGPGVSTSEPGYKGSLEGDFTGIAEVMAESGYQTYQVGKWHLGDEPDQTPQGLGFQQNFTLLDAASSYYSDATRFSPRQEEPVNTVKYDRNGQPVDSLPDDFYSTHAFTDEMLTMIEEGQDSDQPFFGYLAYNAPHDPLQIQDDELVNHYLDLYRNDNNYEELRERRIDRLVERGLLDTDVETRSPSQVPEWNSLTPEQQHDLAYRLAIYAAIIHDLDEQIGRVIDHLKETGEYDNTLIVVSSDNGASPASRHGYAHTDEVQAWQDEQYPVAGDFNSYGEPGSFVTMGAPNAQTASGPFFHYKKSVFEGGVRVPVVMKQPHSADRDQGRVVDTFGHVGDLYPTFADYAGAELNTDQALYGDSVKPLLDGETDRIGSDDYGMELFGDRAYWSGEWKLIFSTEDAGGTGAYSLYNLADDPGETTDVSAENPDIVQELSDKWDQYAEENGVVPVEFEAMNALPANRSERAVTVDWAENIQLPAGVAGE